MFADATVGIVLTRGGAWCRCRDSRPICCYIARAICTVLTGSFDRPLDDLRSIPRYTEACLAPGPGNVDAGDVAGYR